MKRLTLFLLVFISLSMSALAQEGGEGSLNIPWPDRQVWPESPRAAQLRQVMMPTPGLLTGAVEFEVPIYTIEAEGVSIPISLKYRSNGIKVDDDPQPVGYGWTLTPALRVTRRIMGRPDEYFAYKSYSELNVQDKDLSFKNIYGCVTSYYSETPGGDAQHPRFDSEHDIFTFYLLDKSLTVIFNEGKFTPRFNSEYRIENDAKLSYIHVTDPKGVKYEFTEKGEYTGNQLNTTEWLLKRIVLPSGNSIDFSWMTSPHYGRGSGRFAPMTYKYSNSSYFWDSASDPRTGDWQNPFITFNTKNISQITFPGGKIVYNYQLGMLSTVTIFDTVGSTVSRAGFSYEKADTFGYLLKSASITGLGDYTFDYNSNRFDTDAATDWWGFYNGKYNDWCHSPQIGLVSGGLTNYTPQKTIKGADRSVDTDLMQANLLTKAVFPTGASVEWTYEPHRFLPAPIDPMVASKIDVPILDHGGGVRVKTVTLKNGVNDPEPQVRHYSYGMTENGNAVYTALPSLNTFISETLLLELVGLSSESESNVPYCLSVDNYMTINDNSDYMTGQIGAPEIWYEKVTEYCDEGKTEYIFKNYCNKNQVRRDWGYVMPQVINTVYSQGPQMVNKRTYKSEANNRYSLVEEDSVYYTLLSNPAYDVPSTSIRRRLIQLEHSLYSPDFGDETNLTMTMGFKSEENPFTLVAETFNSLTGISVVIPILVSRNDYDWYDIEQYDIRFKLERYLGKKTITYTDNGTIERTERVEYVPGTELIARRTVSDGCDSIVTAYTYPSAAKGGINAFMVAKNVIGSPIEVAMSYRGATQGYSLDMRQWGNSSNAVFRPVRIKQFNRAKQGAGIYIWSLNDYTYDSRGNITSSTDSAGIVKRWIWDAQGLYPVTETISRGNMSLTSQATWKTFVGVTSISSPAGITNNFSYDSENRLSSVSLTRTDNKTKVLQSYTYKISQYGDNNVASKTYLSASASHDVIERYDCRGRLRASIDITPGGPVATLIEYDAMGREWRKYSPAPVDTDNPDDITISSSASQFYSDSYPFAQNDYERSPRNLLISSTKAGQLWHNGAHNSTVELRTNDKGAYICPRYEFGQDGITHIGNYQSGLLTVEVSTDEDGVCVETYKDLRGLIICRKTGDAPHKNITSYVYDRLGQLRYVLPPGLSGSHKRSDSEIQKLAFIYDYDSRGRCVMTKIPGVKMARYLYDPADRLVAEQSKDMPENTWRFYGYDGLGRQVLAIDTYPSSGGDGYLERWSSIARTASVDAPPYYNEDTEEYDSYTIRYNFEQQIPLYDSVLWEKYYDNYDFVSHPAAGSDYEFNPMPEGILTPGLNYIAEPKGLLTGLYSNGFEAYYYDTEGRELQRSAGKGGFYRGRRTMLYTYDGQPARTVYNYPDNKMPRRTTVYEYDAIGRQTAVTEKIYHPIGEVKDPSKPSLTAVSEYDLIRNPSDPDDGFSGLIDSIVVRTSYDRIGRMSTVKLGNAATRSFSYDIHGWLNQSVTVTTPWSPSAVRPPAETVSMTETLLYANGLKPCYNGNISSKVRDTGQYNYSYDACNRLTAAVFVAPQGSMSDFSASYSYDSRANITNLKRNGVIDRTPGGDEQFGLLDDIYMSYDGNRLTELWSQSQSADFESRTGLGSVSSATFDYDDSGRLISDESRGILQISYNNDGLPTQLYTADGHRHNDYYDAFGNKLSTSYYASTRPVAPGELPSRVRFTHSRKYTGDGHVFNGDTLIMTRVAGGYFDRNSRPHYYITDYQGNITAVVDAEGKVVQQTEYYPYGEPWRKPDGQPWLYGGKERLIADGRDEYDFGPRALSATGRFNNPDSLAYLAPEISIYSYCQGNPVNAIDLDGNIAIFINGMHGGSGGTSSYWDGFDKAFLQEIGETSKPIYIDGSCGGWKSIFKFEESNLSSQNRYDYGYGLGEKMALSIIKGLKPDETIKIITHSMGASTAKGFINGFRASAIEHHLDVDKLIEYELDLAPFQPTQQQPCDGVTTRVVQHRWDGIAGASKMSDLSSLLLHKDIIIYDCN